MRTLAALVAVIVMTGGCAWTENGARRSAGSPSPGTSSPGEPSPLPTPPSKRFRFLAIGDYGAGTSQQHAIGRRMCRVRQSRGFRHVVTTGDNIYDEGHPSRFDEGFFEPFDCLLDAGVRFRATLGNHDIVTDNGRPELEEPAFGFRGRNYVWRAGGVRFVMVDSNNLRMRWLRGALRTEEGDRWTIVVFHHPVYSTGEHGSTPGFRPALPRMFRRKGVDLVLNGHDHDYEVTKELRGIRYVVTGGGGASIRACGEPAWFTNVCLERFHFLEVVAGPDLIRVKAIPRRGRFFHRFTTDGRD